MTANSLVWKNPEPKKDDKKEDENKDKDKNKQDKSEDYVFLQLWKHNVLLIVSNKVFDCSSATSLRGLSHVICRN